MQFKGQGQLRDSACETVWAGYRLQFLLDHFQSSQSCKLWMMREGTLTIFGCRIKGQGQLVYSVHNTDYSFCPITFKVHMHVVDDERRNPIDFRSRGKSQGQLRESACETVLAGYRLQFLSDHFQTSYVRGYVVDDEMRDPIHFEP